LEFHAKIAIIKVFRFFKSPQIYTQTWFPFKLKINAKLLKRFLNGILHLFLPFLPTL